MRFTLFAVLVALMSLLAAPAPAQPAQCGSAAPPYQGLYDQGLELEARAAAMASGARRAAAYRRAARMFEQALCARAQQGISDHRIYVALGTVYLGAGDLVQADRHLRVGRANERFLGQADKGRLYAALGYLNALRGDNAAARQHYQIAARLRNRSAAQSLAALQSRQSQ